MSDSAQSWIKQDTWNRWRPLLSLKSRKVSVQFSSVAQSWLTLCNPMNCSTPGLPVHHQLPESTQTHVHWVSDTIQPSHPLSSPSPSTLNLSQHQSVFRWVSSSHQVANVRFRQVQTRNCRRLHPDVCVLGSRFKQWSLDVPISPAHTRSFLSYSGFSLNFFFFWQEVQFSKFKVISLFLPSRLLA